ncbi:MAG: Fe-S cluster assembly ATPase SufC [Patescibacteria group bacterium]
MLELNNIHVSRGDAEIVHGVSLTIGAGEVHVILGKNGSGKTSLLNAVMGHPAFLVTLPLPKGESEGAATVILDGTDITTVPTHEKARAGLFLSLQQPPEVPGVPLEEFLRTAKTALTGEQPKTIAFAGAVSENIAKLRLDSKFAERSVNVGASGGEKKRAEMVQMLTLAPKYALLDEPDSGLDADALHYVADAISSLRNTGTGFLVVSHYAAFIELLQPTAIHVMRDGRIVQSGTVDILKDGIAKLL